MKRYFVYSCETPTGATVVEKELFSAAKRNYLHAVIHEDMLPAVVSNLEKIQDGIWENNKRIKKVGIELCDSYDYHPEYRSISVGRGRIHMYVVSREYSGRTIEREEE